MNVPQIEPSALSAGRMDYRPFESELRIAAANWMQGRVFARETPSQLAIVSTQGSRTFAQLEENVLRLMSSLKRRGLAVGDAVALMCRNRAEFAEVFVATMRCGLRLTPIGTQLTADEVRYIVRDCQARLLFVEIGLAGVGLAESGVEEIVIGSPCSARDSEYEAMLRSNQLTAPDAENDAVGTLMLYTSGTTGRPKGVHRSVPEIVFPQFAGTFANYLPGDVGLCCGPAYHAASLLFDIRWPLASGVPIVMMEKWDALTALRLIEQHSVTHVHMVPTMFQRLLALSEPERNRFDVSSLRMVVHGAAPVSVSVKRAMIDWLGPILTEYYGATEGGEGINVDSHQWLKKPGTVGRLTAENGHKIMGDDGNEVAAGMVGKIFLRAPVTGKFEYFGDATKTQSAYAGNFFTLGDLGYVDDEGYLFIAGRTAECIISGGVNIYPREIDEVMLQHPAVAEACTIGAPDEVWGERVVSVVVLRPEIEQSPALAEALVAHAATQLAKFKRPREIVFENVLPHSGSGKLLRNEVRKRFWVGRERSI
jgi:long-chain acyl-CoA synthetase